MVAAPFSLLGHHYEAPCPLLHGALEGENSVHLWMCDGSAIGIVPSLEASSLEIQLSCGIAGVDDHGRPPPMATHGGMMHGGELDGGC